MMGFMIYFVINMRFLRFLRFFEKWSELEKIRKNQEKWGKKPGAESPYIHYSPGRIIRGSLTVTESKNILSEEVKVNIVVNGKEQVNQSIVKKSGDICSCTIFRDPIELKQCDIINFISRTANSKITNAYVSILIELDL